MEYKRIGHTVLHSAVLSDDLVWTIVHTICKVCRFNYLKLLEGLILAEVSVILGRDTICKSLINQCNDEAEVVQ